MILPLYIHFTRKFDSVRLGELLCMILAAIVPFINLAILIALIFFAYDWNGVFKRVIFEKRK